MKRVFNGLYEHIFGVHPECDKDRRDRIANVCKKMLRIMQKSDLSASEMVFCYNFLNTYTVTVKDLDRDDGCDCVK